MWKSRLGKRQYYECSLDGEKKRVLTEDDFEALARGAGIIKADDQYVYYRISHMEEMRLQLRSKSTIFIHMTAD